MNDTQTWAKRAAIGVACALAAGCGGDTETLHVRALVADTHVYVSVHPNTETCFSAGEFRQSSGCRSLTWKFNYFDDCLSRACVRQIRLENGSGPAQVADDNAAVAEFDLSEPLDQNARVVIDTCHGTTALELPAASAASAPSFEWGDSDREVVVNADPESAGVYATMASLLSIWNGYFTWCEADGATTALPVSDEYPDYLVDAFAYDKPVIVDRAGVHAELFPATYAREPLLEGTDLGADWDLTVSVAKSSSMYAPCADYCAAWDTACGTASADVTNCATTCTISGGVFASCNQEYRAVLRCLTNTPDCGGAPPGSTPTICADENDNYNECASK